MKYTDEEMEIIIDFYEKQGIVTRKECLSIDSIPFGRGLVEEMEKRGYFNVGYVEENIENYHDYSGAIYNEDIYDMFGAKEYLKTYVLDSKIKFEE